MTEVGVSKREEEDTMEQTKILADYIISEIEGEPSRSEGAGDTAVRLLRSYRERVQELETANGEMRKILEKFAYSISMLSEYLEEARIEARSLLERGEE